LLEKQNNGAARKSEQAGKIGPKRSDRENKGVSTYGTKITQSLGLNLNRKSSDSAICTSEIIGFKLK